MPISTLHRVTLGLALAGSLLAASAVQADYVKDREEAVKLYWQDKTPEAMAMFIRMGEESTIDMQKADAYDWASKAAIRLRKFDEAMQYANQIPVDAMARTARARVLVRQGQWQEVVEQFKEQDLTTWPTQAAGEAYLHRATAQERLENPVAAAEDYAFALPLAADHNAKAAALLGLGRARQATGDTAGAIEAWQQVFTESNNIARHTDAGIAIAAAYRVQDKPDEALAALEKVDTAKLRIPSLQADLLVAKAQALAAKGDKAKAVSVYQEALQHKGASEARKQQITQELAALEKQ